MLDSYVIIQLGLCPVLTRTVIKKVPKNGSRAIPPHCYDLKNGVLIESTWYPQYYLAFHNQRKSGFYDSRRAIAHGEWHFMGSIYSAAFT